MNQIFYENIFLTLKNITGKSFSRKIVVIECDDWGGIRIPSKNVYNNLLKEGVPLTESRYRFDTLECREDLEMLFDVLSGVRDKNGKFAVMTAVTVVANPDFLKIKESGFSEYYYEKFTETLERYYPTSDVFGLWEEGINSGIFIPELHGRDHITVKLWLDKLKGGDQNLLKAFENGIVSVYTSGLPEPAKEFRPEFYFTSETQKPFLENSIREGVRLFKEIFGFLPRAFVPSNNIFHPDFDKIVADEGIRFLYVSHRMPYPSKDSSLRYRYFLTNFKKRGDLLYYTRNCAFEPTAENYNGIELTLKQIASAFRWGKPAFISTHRANFTGSIEPRNRERGLKEFTKLLNEIIRRWPDVEFMSSSDALNLF